MASGMLHHLGQACRDARLNAGLGQIDIASRAGMVSHASISRFEAGVRWPLNVDTVVNAYAVELDVSALDLWTEATIRWQESK